MNLGHADRFSYRCRVLTYVDNNTGVGRVSQAACLRNYFSPDHAEFASAILHSECIGIPAPSRRVAPVWAPRRIVARWRDKLFGAAQMRSV